MLRRLTPLMALVVIVAAVGCSRQEPADPAAAAFEAFRAAYTDAPSRADQIAALEGFVGGYPGHPYAGYYAADLISYYAHDLGQPETAYDKVSAVLARVEDPEARLYLAAELAPVAAELGRPVDLEPYIDAVRAQGPLAFDQLDTVMTAAGATGDWQLALSASEEALARATPEAYRADYPDRDFSDEEVAERVRRRRAAALTHHAWALYNTGAHDEAFGEFEQADELRVDSYVGVSGGPLDRLWARALLDAGQPAAALDRITQEALFGDTAKALPVALAAYAAVEGGVDGFDAYLAKQRRDRAPILDDVTLADYEGRQHSLNDLRRDKVLLLAFWFPT